MEKRWSEKMKKEKRVMVVSDCRYCNYFEREI